MTALWVCAAHELPAGSSITVHADERIAVFHTDDGELFATSDTCTHENWSLGEDSDLEGCEVVCPLHMARFDLRSGKPLGLPATIPLRTYEVRMEDGVVFVVV
jgi:nitrite reductase/ring-hydroxylating ferredoxin subunit